MSPNPGFHADNDSNPIVARQKLGTPILHPDDSDAWRASGKPNRLITTAAIGGEVTVYMAPRNHFLMMDEHLIHGFLTDRYNSTQLLSEPEATPIRGTELMCGWSVTSRIQSYNGRLSEYDI
jgi:hypothetical protein